MPNDIPEQPYLFQPPEPPPRPAPQDIWRLRDLALLILFVFADYLFSDFVGLSGYALLRPLMGWRTDPHQILTSPVFGVVVQVIAYVFLFVYLFFLVTAHYRLPFWSGVHWRKITASRAARFFLGGVALSFAVMLTPSFLPEKKHFPLEELFSSPANAYAIAVFAVLIAPFMEELFFRGVLFAYFEKFAGLRFAIFGTAILFATLHIPEYWGAWDHVVLILVVGLVLSSARGLTDSLTPSVIIHVAYNATLMAMLYIQTDQFHKLPALLHF